MNCPDSSHIAQFIFVLIICQIFADAKPKNVLSTFDMMALPQLFALM